LTRWYSKIGTWNLAVVDGLALCEGNGDGTGTTQPGPAPVRQDGPDVAVAWLLAGPVLEGSGEATEEGDGYGAAGPLGCPDERLARAIALGAADEPTWPTAVPPSPVQARVTEARMTRKTGRETGTPTVAAGVARRRARPKELMATRNLSLTVGYCAR
jgi:hypothetical protein